MSTQGHANYCCDVCGEAARVHVLEGYFRGEPVIRRLCFRCASRFPPSVLGGARDRPRIGIAALIGLAGVVFGMVGVFADALIPEGHAGFGWYQRTGVALAVVIALVGMLMRADVVMLGGLFLFVAALCADWIGGARTPGIGSKQEALLAIGTACVACALIARFARPFLRTRALSLLSAVRHR